MGETIKIAQGETQTYKVISLDVWGNQREGFEVNAAYYTGLEVDLPEYATDEEIIQQLKSVGYLKKGLHTKSFQIDGEPDFTMYVDHQKFGPVCHLENKNRSLAK